MAGVEDIPLEHVSLKEFIFGVPSEVGKAKIINYILITVKLYITRQKLYYNGQLSMIQWLGEFRSKLITEEYICQKKGAGTKFAMWRNILKALG